MSKWTKDTFVSAAKDNCEPRISNIQVTVSNYPDSHELNATIQYDITGAASPSQTVDVLLQPARL